MRLTAIVPATSANLGPGFDCFGLALDLCNEVAIDTEAEASITWEGEGAGELPTDGTDMVGRAILHTARVAGAPPPAFGRHGRNRIPLERGLGSSAAACVAGILLADRLLGLRLEPEEVLEIAADLEGHADNAAAAIAGGLTLAFGDGVVRLDPHPDLRPVVLVPLDVRLPTAEARDVLDDTVSRADAVFNASHAAAAVVALIARPELLTQVLEDRLHQDARLALLPSVKALFDDLRGIGVPVCVSGAGPSLLAFELPGETVPEPGEGWRMLRPAVRSAGAELRDS
ncbi:MAG TPA: homoserine kinase [Actinomycetota bacterium]|jgi:homoserine kinase|nr:homoserine kinase [Actinomycetota bacterium]